MDLKLIDVTNVSYIFMEHFVANIGRILKINSYIKGKLKDKG